MSDNKKYYYLKLKENFFESDTLILLESQKDGYLYSNILLKLYLRSLKNEGRLAFNNLIPYNVEMLATLTRHQVGTVEKALRMFEQLGLIEILDNGVIYMTDIQNFIGKSSSEADRQREYQKRITDEKQKLLEPCKKSCKKSNKKTTPEIEKDIENRERDRDRYSADAEESGAFSPSQIVDLFHSICKSYPKVRSISDRRKKAIQARLRVHGIDTIKEVFEKAEKSDFLKGKNNKNWSADFDWIMTDGNFSKILDGKYDNRQKGVADSQTYGATYDISAYESRSVIDEEDN
jgi:predicted phage replisome organizer